MVFSDSRHLVETAWLDEHLGEPDLRILDCTVFLDRDSTGRFRIESGRAAWVDGHIPGSTFVDLAADLSDRSTETPFVMPPVEQFASEMSRCGVGEGTRVVLYDRAMNMWAARLWWMLRAFGFDDAAVLNGGWRKWTLDGRPISMEPAQHQRGNFVARPRPELIASRDDVLSAISDDGACIVNGLSEEMHRTGVAGYGRPGRIPSSVNVPVSTVVDPETHSYLSEEELRDRFSEVGETNPDRVVTYCLWGIAASSEAFILSSLGYNGVAMYDGSLSEWASDSSLPMEVGD